MRGKRRVIDDEKGSVKGGKSGRVKGGRVIGRKIGEG